MLLFQKDSGTKRELLFLLSVMKCYPFDEMLLSFNYNFTFSPIWVWYWNILLSGKMAFIKYCYMNNICKCVRHIFHQAQMNWFLVLPDVFAVWRNSIWSEWQNKQIHPSSPVVWAGPLLPFANGAALSDNSDGIVLPKPNVHLSSSSIEFLKWTTQYWKLSSWKWE